MQLVLHDSVAEGVVVKEGAVTKEQFHSILLLMGHLKELRKFSDTVPQAKKKVPARPSTTFEDLERRIQQLEQTQFSDAWSYLLT